METVSYFSSMYTEDLDRLMISWQPKGEVAKNWQTGMVDYVNGEWFNKMEKKLQEDR